MSAAILSTVFSLYFVGGRDEEYNSHDEILELVDVRWKQVASMQNARNAHAVAVINIEEYWGFCTGNYSVM